MEISIKVEVGCLRGLEFRSLHHIYFYGGGGSVFSASPVGDLKRDKIRFVEGVHVTTGLSNVARALPTAK